MYPKSQPEDQIHLSVVRPPLHSPICQFYHQTILHVYCRNPRESQQPAVYCLCQLTHVVVLVLKQL